MHFSELHHGFVALFFVQLDFAHHAVAADNDVIEIWRVTAVSASNSASIAFQCQRGRGRIVFQTLRVAAEQVEEELDLLTLSDLALVGVGPCAAVPLHDAV